MKCIYIYNPNSGKGKSKKNLAYITHKLRTKYSVVDTYATTAPKDLTHRLKLIGSEYDLVVFSGGDGTFNEVVQAIATLETKPTVAYIPTGTVNDVARTLRIPRTIKGAVKNILYGDAVAVDCLKINERYAMYIVCAGFFTRATYSTPQSYKKLFGKLAYAVEGLTKNMDMPVIHLQVFGENGEQLVETDCLIVFVLNTKSVSGFKVNSHASLTDGKVEIAIIRQSKRATAMTKMRALWSMIKFFIFGYRIKEKNIIRFEGKHFEFKTDRDVVWNYDGEKGKSGNIVLDVLPDNFCIILPRKGKNI